MLIFKVLHIVSMFTMVTAFSGSQVFYAVAIWQRDARALAWVHRSVRRSRLPFVALGFLFAGVVFGLLTAATGGLDFFKGWLIAAYVLVAVFLVVSALLADKVVRLADKAVESDAAKLPTEEVFRDTAAGQGVLLLAVNAAFFVAIIVDMVVKPF